MTGELDNNLGERFSLDNLRRIVVKTTLAGLWGLAMLGLQTAGILLLGVFALTVLWRGATWLFWAALALMQTYVVDVPVDACLWVLRQAWKAVWPDPPTRTERVYAAFDRATDVAWKGASIPVQAVEDAIGWDTIAAGLVWTVAAVSFWYLWLVLLSQIRKKTLSRRGVHVTCEAVNAGSTFIVTKPYSCVINVLAPGFFVDSFHGMGGRVGDWLVLPKHVYDAAVEEGTILLQNPDRPGAKALVKGFSVQSATYTDVIYVKVPSQVWATLGISKAPKPQKVREDVTAAVWGHKGKTTGVCGRMQQPEYLYYTGTTVPGYSGAFYFTITGAWLGMHLGAITGQTTNVGARSDVISLEVDGHEAQYVALNPEGFRSAEQANHDGSHSSDKSASGKAKQHTARQYDEEDQILYDRARSQFARAYKPTADEELERYARDAPKKSRDWDLSESLARQRAAGCCWADECDIDEEAFKRPKSLVKAVFGALDAEDRKDLLAVLSTMELAPKTTPASLEYDTEGPTGGKALQDNAAHLRIDKLTKRVEALEASLKKVRDERKRQEAKKKPAPEEKKTTQVVEKKVEEPEPKAAPKQEPSPQRVRQCVVAGCKRQFESRKKLSAHYYFRHVDQMPQIRKAERKKLMEEATVSKAVVIATEASEPDSVPEIATKDGAPFLEKRSPTQKSKN